MIFKKKKYITSASSCSVSRGLQLPVRKSHTTNQCFSHSTHTPWHCIRYLITLSSKW